MKMASVQSLRDGGPLFVDSKKYTSNKQKSDQKSDQKSEKK